jgi:site-specific DNA recombinase
MFWRWRPTPPWGTDMLAKVEEREFHEDAVTRFQDDLNRLATPLIHALHADRLDGKVGGRFFEEKSAEWREEQRQIQRSID